MPFSEVDADFAATEGEGDGSLAYWQRAHKAFFGRECQRLGREFSPAHLLSARGLQSYTEAPARMRSNKSLERTRGG